MGSHDPERVEAGASTKPEILDGRDTKDLNSAMKKFILENGLEVIAGTDKGVDYKDRNEDRVAVVPESNFVAVVDGMGGHEDGDKAAQLLAEEFSKKPLTLDRAAEIAVERMRSEGLDSSAGAVFVAVLMLLATDGKYYANFSMAGDSRIVVSDSRGQVKFESEDQSLVASLVKEKVLTKDQSLYNDHRYVVNNPVSAHPFEIKHFSEMELEKGDKVFLMSDGIADNLTPEEIGSLSSGKSAADSYLMIARITEERMTNYEAIKRGSDRATKGIYSDGFLSKPKRDNRALAVFEIR